jgi:hypothetical protein
MTATGPGPKRRSGRPGRSFRERMPAVALREKARYLARLLAIGTGPLSRAQQKDFRELPIELQEELVQSAIGKHHRYLHALLRKEVRPPPVHEPWWHGTDEASRQKRLDWCERTFGSREIELAARAAAERGEPFRQFHGVVKTIRPPAYVGRVFGRIDAIIARRFGIATSTLRYWCAKAMSDLELSPKERAGSVRRGAR